MTIILRTWKKAYPDTLWSIWDAGSEFWELKDGHIRHFSVIERYKEGELIIEKVQLLRESPIPLEVVRQTILGWEVSEVEAPEVIQPPQKMHMPQVQQQRAQQQAQVQQQQVQVQQQQVQVQQQQAPAQTQAQRVRKSTFQPLTQGPAFLPDTHEDVSEHPPPHSPSQPPPFAHTPTTYVAKRNEDKRNEAKRNEAKRNEEDTQHEEDTVQEGVCSKALASQEELSAQESYNAPTELWSALSQWIPPNALFQPSLHHQAFLELSGTQEKSYPVKRSSETNVRQKEARLPYVAPARNSRPYPPKTFVQQKRVSGPLFI